VFRNKHFQSFWKVFFLLVLHRLLILHIFVKTLKSVWQEKQQVSLFLLSVVRGWSSWSRVCVCVCVCFIIFPSHTVALKLHLCQVNHTPSFAYKWRNVLVFKWTNVYINIDINTWKSTSIVCDCLFSITLPHSFWFSSGTVNVCVLFFYCNGIQQWEICRRVGCADHICSMALDMSLAHLLFSLAAAVLLSNVVRNSVIRVLLTIVKIKTLNNLWRHGTGL